MITYCTATPLFVVFVVFVVVLFVVSAVFPDVVFPVEFVLEELPFVPFVESYVVVVTVLDDIPSIAISLVVNVAFT